MCAGRSLCGSASALPPGGAIGQSHSLKRGHLGAASVPSGFLVESWAVGAEGGTSPAILQAIWESQRIHRAQGWPSACRVLAPRFG